MSILLTLELTAITCGECGLTFGVPTRWREARMEDHATFFCPNGHQRVYNSKSEAEKLKTQLHEERMAREQAEAATLAAENAAASAQRKLTRLTKRVSAGVCPHCTRTVSQLARHIACKHPDKV